MNTARNHEWQDSLIDWAEHQHFDRERLALMTLEYTAADRHECESYGECNDWPARRAALKQPTLPVIDRMREEYDAEDQTESADAEVMVWILKGMCVVVTALLCAWVIAGSVHV